MKKFVFVFHAIQFIYLVLSVLLILNYDQSHKILGLETSNYILYWAMLGIGLYTLLWLKDVFETFNLKRKLRNMEAEKNRYKAALYDKTERDIQFDNHSATDPAKLPPKKDTSDTA
ncbi:hypothetical protein QQ020_30790 [Fulvivirgaceae bacterium BMA12]|uniref:Uncharacterized protein n=1 Tax=Agaribacillus aureus TaxID=3051825 RepID=A0ABT8LH31_9BACT|nr:hypothetical protein [Fulvivirgaceae bacterium BMA12]